MGDPALFARQRFARVAAVWAFAWADWQRRGDRMVSPTGKRSLTLPVFERLSRAERPEAPAAPAPAAPAAPAAPPADLNEHLKRARPPGTDPKLWRRLLFAQDVRSAARSALDAERSDDPYDRATWRRGLEYRLEQRKLPTELVGPAIEMARAERAFEAARGPGFHPPQPVRAGRYLGRDEFNRARYRGVNDVLHPLRTAYQRVVDGLRERVAELAPGAHLGADAVGDGDPWKDARVRFIGATDGNWWDRDANWKDPRHRTPANLKAAWAAVVEPKLAEGRELMAVLGADRTFRRDTDPEELVRHARGTENYYVRRLLGKVLERVHGVAFAGHWHADREARVPTWDDVLKGTAELKDVAAARAAQKAADAARRDGYARQTVAGIQTAVKALAAGKPSEHWPSLNRRLRLAGAGRIEKRQATDYGSPHRPRVDEFFFWPAGGGTAVVARTVPALLDKLRLIALSLSARTATEEQLDKLRRG